MKTNENTVTVKYNNYCFHVDSENKIINITMSVIMFFKLIYGNELYRDNMVTDLIDLMNIKSLEGYNIELL